MKPAETVAHTREFINAYRISVVNLESKKQLTVARRR
jgi:ribosomal protein L7Ae-like RNA K-turn-binding protein